MAEEESSLWVSTTESAICKWNISNLKYNYTEDIETHLDTYCSTPLQTIKGNICVQNVTILLIASFVIYIVLNFH